MKLCVRWNILIFVVACIGVSMGCRSNVQKASTSGDKVTVATEFVQSLASGRFAAAASCFDATMRQAMSADQLEQAWNALTGQNGAFKRMCETRTGQEAGFDIVLVACQFEKTTLDIKVVFDHYGTIGGLWFVPHAQAPKAEYSRPAYARMDRFDEREITVGRGEWKLPGTLSVPNGKGPFPAVVLVHGSGPNDRDETIVANKPFRDLAYGLASRGVAVLRYDKRTKVYSKKLMSATDLTAKEEVIDDAIEAVSLLRKTALIDPKRIFVLGHSLGGTLVPRIGKADPNIAGLIVMAGSTRPLEDVVVEQMTYLAGLGGSISSEGRKQIETVKQAAQRIKDPGLSSRTPSSKLLGVPASYWLDLRSYRPAEMAKSVLRPMLILQGERDYQVTVEDYGGWKSALSSRTDVTFKLYPKLNHLFVEGVGKSKPVEYETLGHVSDEMISDVVHWIDTIRPR